MWHLKLQSFFTLREWLLYCPTLQLCLLYCEGVPFLCQESTGSRKYSELQLKNSTWMTSLIHAQVHNKCNLKFQLL